MAFRNTSERYEYIYGSNARKMEREEPRAYGSAQPAETPDEDQKPKERRRRRRKSSPRARTVFARNRARLAVFDWKYTMVILFAVLLCASGAFLYVRQTAVIREKEQQVYDLKEEKVKLVGKQTALRSELEKSIDLTEIEKYAKEKLDMVYPKNSKILFYEADPGDYFRQYESVGAE